VLMASWVLIASVHRVPAQVTASSVRPPASSAGLLLLLQLLLLLLLLNAAV